MEKAWKRRRMRSGKRASLKGYIPWSLAREKLSLKMISEIMLIPPVDIYDSWNLHRVVCARSDVLSSRYTRHDRISSIHLSHRLYRLRNTRVARFFAPSLLPGLFLHHSFIQQMRNFFFAENYLENVYINFNTQYGLFFFLTYIVGGIFPSNI